MKTAVALAAVLVVYLPMLAEARRAARNERAQRARGGIEPDHDVYGMMRVAYPLAFLLMIADGSQASSHNPGRMVAGLSLFAVAKVLKWWAILTLGGAWTFRVLVVPGSTPLTSGPYRYLRHPNYVGVIGELLGVAIIMGAFRAGPPAVVGFALLVWRRIRVEEKAMAQHV
jgi:methyltransferase